MFKYAIAADGGGYLDVSPRASYLFPDLDNAPLYDSQEAALSALQLKIVRRTCPLASSLRLVRVDEVAHAGETKEVRRKFSEPKAEGTISTRYEIDKHCPRIGFCRKATTVDALLNILTAPGERCSHCGTFTVEAIDTVQLPPYTTRVASELR